MWLKRPRVFRKWKWNVLAIAHLLNWYMGIDFCVLAITTYSIGSRIGGMGGGGLLMLYILLVIWRVIYAMLVQTRNTATRRSLSFKPSKIVSGVIWG